MASEPPEKRAKRPIAFVALGIALLALAAYLIYDIRQQQFTIAPAPSAYKYGTTQSVRNTVNYNNSSFFANGPGANDTAYVAELTDTISSTFHYAYHANQATDLTYSYGVQAEVRSTYAAGGDSEKSSNVWNRQFELLQPVSTSVNSKGFSVDPIVTIPYATYRDLTDQFRKALSLPVNSEVVVTFTMRVSGKAGGTPFNDTKTATITAPLDQQVYQLATKYTKADQQTVLPQQSQKIEDILSRYEIVIAVVFGLAGLASMVYGFRRQIFKSPYQRELEKIYRYHDGLIIRASRPANLANKNIVAVESFNDILNIEEEIKAPIIASPAGPSATQFLITRDDVVYVYTLGELSAGGTAAPTQNSTPQQPQQHKRPVVKRKVSG